MARRAGLFLAALLEKHFIPREAKEVNLKNGSKGGSIGN